MSVGNLKDQGNQGKNTPFQLRSLQLLGAILVAVGGSPIPIVITPTLLRDTKPGTIPAGKKSVSVYNAGIANGVWLGEIIKPGEQFTYSVNAPTEGLAEFPYDGSGTELVITTTY